MCWHVVPIEEEWLSCRHPTQLKIDDGNKCFWCCLQIGNQGLNFGIRLRTFSILKRRRCDRDNTNLVVTETVNVIHDFEGSSRIWNKFWWEEDGDKEIKGEKSESVGSLLKINLAISLQIRNSGNSLCYLRK